VLGRLADLTEFASTAVESFQSDARGSRQRAYYVEEVFL